MISIVTPTYNSEKYLEECILSIKNQKYTNYEHIIVDGGSTDRTLEIIKKYDGIYPMRRVSEKDNGMYDAISKGFKMAKGDIFCWLNSDDVYMPWATTVMEMVCKSGKVHWCSGLPSYMTGDSVGYQIPGARKVFSRRCIEKGYMRAKMMGSIQQESCFWTRELWEKSGGLNSKYLMAGDYHLWREFAKYEPLYSVNSVIACFRIHEGQKSSDRSGYCDECGTIKKTDKFLSKAGYFRLLNHLTQQTNKGNLIYINKADSKLQII